MDRMRVKDWLLGAVGMLILLVLVTAFGWWAVTSPTGTGERATPSRPDSEDLPWNRKLPGNLRDGQVWLPDVRLDARTVVTAGSSLRGVRAIGVDVVTRREALVAARLTVRATVPFDVVADELGGDTTVRAAADGQATVTRTVEALGRELRVDATGTVEVVAGKIVVEPQSIDLGGPGFLSEALADIVRRLVTIEHPVEGLPDGLVLEDVTVTGDGFRAVLRGHDVRLIR